MITSRNNHPMMISCDVIDLRFGQAGLTLQQAAAICGVSVRTIRRWEKAGACPVWFSALLTAYAGDLGGLRGGEDWRGWRLVRGRLVSPEGDIFTPGQLRSIRWLYGEAQALRAQVRKLSAPGTQIPLPISWL